MKKRKVAILANSMIIGGIEKALVEFSKVLDYDRCEFTLWLNSKSGPMLEQLDPRMDIREFAKFDTKELLWEQLRSGKLLAAAAGIYNRFMARVHVKNYERNACFSTKILPKIDEVYDCVLVYQDSFGAVAAALYRFHGTKRAFWVHGIHNGSGADFSYRNKIYGKFDRGFFVSSFAMDDFCNKIPSARRNGQVLRNIVNTQDVKQKAAFAPDLPLQPTALVTVGRLSEEKGQDMIPKATRLLLDAGYEIYWYLVGDGALRSKIREQSAKYGVEGHVILLGAKENPYPYIKNCDIYVQTSFLEGYCTTTMEAKILQKPVVTTDAPGMREQFVSGENGLIVNAMTPESLYEGIKTLLDHPELCDKFVEALKKESFDNTAELQKLYDFIED